MKIAIVFQSATGNTAMVARAIQEKLSDREIVWYGEPGEKIEADLYFAGSWTDKGTCTPGMAAFLKNLRGKTVAYFATAGFGGSPEYYAALFERVKTEVPEENRLTEPFFCQGKMPGTVRERYVRQLSEHPDDAGAKAGIDNFDRALLHPDGADLQAAAVWAAVIAESCEKGRTL